MEVIAWLAIAGLFTFLDRFWGAKKPAFKGKKALIFLLAIGLPAVIAWYTDADPAAAAMFGALWLAWRSIPFFAGSAAPHTTPERIACVARNAPVIPLAMFIALWRDLPVVPTGWYFTGFAFAAISLAYAYGMATERHFEEHEPGGQENPEVELVRGFVGGAAIGAGLYYPLLVKGWRLAHAYAG